MCLPYLSPSAVCVKYINAESSTQWEKPFANYVNQPLHRFPFVDRVRPHAFHADDLVARFQQNGLLDDAHYAVARAASLARQGGSPRAIRARLRQKGVDRADIDRAIALRTEEIHEPDAAAAAALVRRCRLGPHRPAPQRAAHRDRDLAALARAGFGSDVARRVIDAPSPEAPAAGEA